MKTIITQTTKAIFLLVLLAVVWQAGAQVPDKFNYQLAVRNAQGEVYANQQVNFRISLMQGSTVIYQESHTVQTNAYGLANLMIGDGVILQGSMATIDWGGEAKSLMVEFDPSGGVNYIHLATTPLVSVPYAMYAKNSAEPGPEGPQGSPGPQGPQGEQGPVGPMPPIGGTNTQVQYNNNGSFAGSNNFVFNPSTIQVGIGTSDPAAQLHVQGTAAGQGNILFAGAYKTSNPGDPPASGEGTRLMWYPDKAAIRAGYVGGTRWDKNNIGNYSVALGYGPLASGANSVAIGTAPTASGSYSTAFGYMTIASGPSSTAFGNAAEASGQWSVAMGNYTTASGANSIAMGKENTAEGENSVTIGRNVRAYSFCETVIGYRNTPYTGSKTDWLPNDRLFVIGNGITTSSNAMTVLKSGFTGIGTDTPQAGLHIRGDGFPASFLYLEANVGNDAGIRIYDGKTAKWHLFNNVAADGLQIYNTDGETAIFAKQSNTFVGLGTTNPTQKLHVVGNAYKTEGGTSWASSSDLRLKTVLGDYEKGLNEITALQPVRFRYLENNPRQLSSDTEQVGFVAQDVQKIFPEAVSQAEDGYLDFNIHAINVALINAVKELKAENDRLKTETIELNSRLERLERLFSVSAQNED
jgi:hypothetical protein